MQCYYSLLNSITLREVNLLENLIGFFFGLTHFMTKEVFILAIEGSIQTLPLWLMDYIQSGVSLQESFEARLLVFSGSF